MAFELLAAPLVGIAQGAFDRCLKYVKKREQFGKKIASFQVNQHKLADMATKIELARLIMGRDGQWDERRYRRLRRQWRGTNMRSLRSAFSQGRYERLRRVSEAVLAANEKAHHHTPDPDASMDERIQRILERSA